MHTCTMLKQIVNLAEVELDTNLRAVPQHSLDSVLQLALHVSFVQLAASGRLTQGRIHQ